MKRTVTNVLIVGVGGQGTLLASRIIGRAALLSGYDVSVSEVHGMSQRGGSVETYVRFGEQVHSPLIDRGCADYILAFEELEACRALPYLKPETGLLIVNRQQIMPMPVLTGKASYPDDPVGNLEKRARICAVDGIGAALACGNPKLVNTYLIGVFSVTAPIPDQVWEQALTECVPARFLEQNQKAFRLGRAFGKPSPSSTLS